MLVALALLFLALVRSEFGTLQSADVRAATSLNSFVGDSETWDLLVLFLTRQGGDVVGSFLVGVTLLMLIRRSGGGLARILVVGGSFVLITIGVDQLIDPLDDFVLRPGPGVVIPAFHSPVQSLQVSYNFPELTRFPCDLAATYSVIFFLCLFRFGPNALPLLGIALAFGEE